jgi:hypothetical protein
MLVGEGTPPDLTMDQPAARSDKGVNLQPWRTSELLFGRGSLRSTQICTGPASLRPGGMVTVAVAVGAGGACVRQRGWLAACVRLVLRRESGLVGSMVSKAAAPVVNNRESKKSVVYYKINFLQF